MKRIPSSLIAKRVPGTLPRNTGHSWKTINIGSPRFKAYIQLIDDCNVEMRKALFTLSYKLVMGYIINRRFEKMNRLYHFTTYDSACMILKSKQLKFGKHFRMNDLIESEKIVFQRTYIDMGKDKYNGLYAEKEMNRYQQISFAQDRVIGGTLYEGFNLHTMWGLYAERGYGVCLVFDKDKLKLGENDYARDVVYEDWVMPGYVFKNHSKAGIRAEIWHRRDEIFFIKRKEWEREQEFRIIRRAKQSRDDEFLDISDSLSFIIITKDYAVSLGESIWDGIYFKHLRYLSGRKPILWYTPSIDGYSLFYDSYDTMWTEEDGFL